MRSILTINNVSKQFNQQLILDHISLTVKPNTILGFIGKNGAGKTTTMKLILGLLKPDSGTLSVCGQPVIYGHTKTNQYIGYLPDVPEFYGYMTPFEYLKLCGELTHVDPSSLKKRILYLLELVELNKNKKIHSFSRGMKQRLGIAQALIHQPKLLICDEPTSALDPPGRAQILNILSSIKQETTIIFSTHILSDVEAICDEIAILDQHKIIYQGPLEDILKHHQQSGLSITFSNIQELTIFQTALHRFDLSIHTQTKNNELIIDYLDPTYEKTYHGIIFNLLQQLNIIPLTFHQHQSSLEDIFMEVTL